jgi:hypothetical protein
MIKNYFATSGYKFCASSVERSVTIFPNYYIVATGANQKYTTFPKEINKYFIIILQSCYLVFLPNLKKGYPSSLASFLML